MHHNLLATSLSDQINSNIKSDALNSPADSQAKYILAEAGLLVDPVLLTHTE